MSFFGKILNKLGFGDAASPSATSSATPPAAAPASSGAPAAPAAPSAPVAAPAAPAVVAITVVDVVAQLESRAQAASQKLNWRTSIVDLLKLLDIESTLDARKALATELGCPADKMADSAQMNTWLHKTVLQQLAAHGGNVPAELLD
jgi:Domain of unknown function (DUF3597)